MMANDLTEETVTEVLELYQKAYNHIFRVLNRASRTSGIVTFTGQKAVLKEVGETLSRFALLAGGSLERALVIVAREAAAKAASDLKMGGKRIEDDRSLALETHGEAYGYIVGQTGRMLASVRQMLRQNAVEVFRRARTSGITRKSAFAKLREQMLSKDPTFHFVDRAGRRWDSKVYFETLVRSVMASTFREAYAESLVSSGHDLAQITLVGSKDACRGWEGKVVSLTGATPGYPTLSRAVASGEVFHPRCRHRLVAYAKP